MKKFNILLLIYVLSFPLFGQEVKTIETDIFKIVYSEEYQQPLSVEYEVQCPFGTASRKGMNFYGVDSVITSNNDDYKSNEWDKGHMAPAADFNCDTETLRKTFSYLNCALQHRGLNRGPWKELEASERVLAEDFYVYVIITIHFDDEVGMLPTGARVPTGFTKEIRIDDTTSFIYDFPNNNVAGTPYTYFKIN